MSGLTALVGRSWTSIRKLLQPERVKAALLLPLAAFIVLELLLEPGAVASASGALLLWAAFFYLLASFAVYLRRRRVQLPRFRSLLLGSLFLAAADHLVKWLVLQHLPLSRSIPLVPGALELTHAHNARGSWLAVELGLNFIGRPILIGISLLFMALTVSVYRYDVSRRGKPSLWTATVLIGVVAAMLSAFADLAFRGFTVDFLGLAGLVVADFKDLYLNVAIAALSAEIAENFAAARRISNRQTLEHVKSALQLSARELRELLT